MIAVGLVIIFTPIFCVTFISDASISFYITYIDVFRYRLIRFMLIRDVKYKNSITTTRKRSFFTKDLFLVTTN